MKIYFLLVLLLSATLLKAQTKEITFAELSPGSNMFFGAQMTPTTITVTFQGPSDRFIALGFGSGMSSGDAMIWSSTGGPLQLRDHNMVGYTTPATDAQQDWTEISNTTNAGNRTIVASRPLNTGDANDVVFNFSASNVLLFWARSGGASNGISNHGGANRASGIVRNWVLLDEIAPLISTLSPSDNAVAVALTTNLVATFNENIAFGIGSTTLYDGLGNVIESKSNGSLGYTISGNTLTFNPTANLILNTNYYIQIDANAITDIAGNPFAGILDNTTWNFNTNDIVAPTLSASPYIPADNSQSVSLTNNMSATFSENIQLGSGVIELYDGTSALVESFNVATSPQLSIASSTLTINPTSDLILNTDYYILIGTTAIQDLSGNNFSGITASTTWNFNTNDIVAPTLVGSFVPADNFTGVDATTNLEASFSENIALGMGNISIFYSSGTPFAVINVATSTEITVNTNQFTIDMIANLDLDESYYIQIDATAITDLSGNSFVGINNATTWNFNTNTSTGPDLIIDPFVPLDNELAASSSGALSITFNENIQLGSVGSVQLFLASGTLVEQFSSGSSALSISANQLSITTTASLLEQTGYYITIDSGFIIDFIGNAFDGFTDNLTWNFTTGDFTPPVLIASPFSPSDDATMVPVSSLFSITFNEFIQIENGFISLMNSGSTVENYNLTTNFSALSVIGNTITINPTNDLAFNEPHNFTIANDAISDISGNYFLGFSDNSTWNFVTEPFVGLDELSQNNWTWNGRVLTQKGTAHEIQFMDVNGRIVKSSSSISIDCSDLQTGVYLIRANSTSTTGKTIRIYVL